MSTCTPEVIVGFSFSAEEFYHFIMSLKDHLLEQN